MNEQPNKKSELARLVEHFAAQVDFDDPGGLLKAKGKQAKIDLLERALEAWRFEERCAENQLTVETFIQTQMFVDDERVVFQLPSDPQELGTGAPSIQFQPQLLLFLLLYHRNKYSVYDIIEKFISKVRDQLDQLDFKKTRTGVTRCFTNTRFAAHTLRDYGLLKFTHVEAYKTWVLSLPGFLVASRVLDRHGADWELSRVEKLHNFDLHPDIRDAWNGLQTYDAFVHRLSWMCEPNVKVFETFEEVLKAAHRLLPGYFEAIQNHTLSQKARRAETNQRLKTLDQHPRMADFYKEFSACINVEQLLKDVE